MEYKNTTMTSSHGGCYGGLVSRPPALTWLVVVHPSEEEAPGRSQQVGGVGQRVPGLQQLSQLGHRELPLAHRHQSPSQPPYLQHKARPLFGNTVDIDILYVYIDTQLCNSKLFLFKRSHFGFDSSNSLKKSVGGALSSPGNKTSWRRDTKP